MRPLVERSAAGPPSWATSGPGAVPPAPAPVRLGFRLESARREIPWVMLWGAVVLTLTSLATFAARPPETSWGWLPRAGMIAGLALLAVILPRPRVPARAVPWAWAFASVAMIAMFLAEYVEGDHPTHVAVMVVLATAFGMISLAWPAFLVGAAGILAVTVAVVGVAGPGLEAESPAVLGIGFALMVSGLLLWARIRSVNRMADMSALVEHLATTDGLTDLLNRRGLSRAFPAAEARARGLGVPITLWFMDIEGLKRANDEHGHDFGDDVIRTVADAIRAAVAPGDIAARIGGDEFVVVGPGGPGADGLPERIAQALESAALDPVKWPGSLRFGRAAGDPDIEDMDALLVRADQDMYARRRGTGPAGEAGPEVPRRG